LPRVVVPGVAHHVTQHGNRRLATFFNEADYAAYLAEGPGVEHAALLRRHERTRRALGCAGFLQRPEATVASCPRNRPAGWLRGCTLCDPYGPVLA
jgi:hypothetical protein